MGNVAPSWTDELSAWGTLIAAIAALMTVVAAVFAARYAKRQVDGVREQIRQAEQGRYEQSLPAVVVYAEVDPLQRHFADLVIRNMGTTGARDVHISCAPQMKRSPMAPGHDSVQFPEDVPFLAAGQEWRTHWDSDISRGHADLPDRYEFTATYSDFMGKAHSTPSVVDWSLMRGRIWASRKSVHDAAEALDRIADVIASWSQRDDVVKVATYDGEAYDRQLADQRERDRAREREFLQTIHEAQHRWREEHPDGQAETEADSEATPKA